jgi:hypothetical protein
MDFFSLPQYPLPTADVAANTRTEDARGDIDWGLLVSRLLTHGFILLLIGLVLFALAFVLTSGQIVFGPMSIGFG